MATTVTPLFPARLDSEFHPYMAGAPGRSHLVRIDEKIQDAIDAATAGDRVYIAPDPDGWDEALTIKKRLSVIGAGPRGSVFIAPAAANATPLKIGSGSATRIPDVTIENIGLETNGTGTALHVEGNVRRARARGCKLEGGDEAILVESTANGSVGDTLIEDCELAWTKTALKLQVSGAGDPVTQTRLKNCLLHNYTVRGVHVDTTHSADLWMHGNYFERDEAGAEPSNEYVLAAVAATTGGLAGNYFPAAEATAKISLAAGVLRRGNWFTDNHDV